MITRGNQITLNNINSNLPDMSDVITSWFLKITLQVVERTLNGADWVETITRVINTKGVVQPPQPQDLKILPAGTWAWEWLTVHCLPDVQLEPNQFIKYDGKTYKVMAKKDWQKYGYIKYILLEAFRAQEL